MMPFMGVRIIEDPSLLDTIEDWSRVHRRAGPSAGGARATARTSG